MSNPLIELAPVIKQRFFDANGEPLSGGQLFSYMAGTTTPLATYTDASGSTPNSNPVILDSAGYADVFMGPSNYKFTLKDSLGSVIFTVDNVQSTAAQLAGLVNVAGALAIINNLSDLNSIPIALKNLGISPYTYPTKFSVTSGQAATNLTGETVDGTVYSSVRYDFEIQQGTTIFSNGWFAIQYVNASWVLLFGESLDKDGTNGVTFSLTQAGSVAQIKAAESGLGNGTIKLKKSYFLVTP